MEEHSVHQPDITTMEAQQVHVATYTEHSMLSADEDSPSSPEDDAYDDSDILNSTGTDDVTAHLAAAGPVGMAAAAAVATGKKRKRPHIFESNPSIRKRQQTRLLRKLRATLDEYTTRVGQQAIVLCMSPSKPNAVFKVFGAAPLENVVRKYKNMILEDLENALAEHAPPPQELSSELPPLTIDGIPVSVDKMTQAQLRAFIPEMLKYSTGRGKPGWGKESCKPMWWPDDIPWANVRSDVRTEDQKTRQVSWTQALRTIVKNCYKQHGREDLLYAFEEQQAAQPHVATATAHSITHLVPSQTVVQTISNPDGTVSLIQYSQVGTGATVATLTDASELPATVTVAQVNYSTGADGEASVRTGGAELGHAAGGGDDHSDPPGIRGHAGRGFTGGGSCCRLSGNAARSYGYHGAQQRGSGPRGGDTGGGHTPGRGTDRVGGGDCGCRGSFGGGAGWQRTRPDPSQHVPDCGHQPCPG
ncbi:nuclear respiratory factor 1-like isoform X5 [Scleropages formosus]|uniref:nuclear respiratory factor 1-like isoform X5 n=1 Tax=Scleropages formosus TaxID=113540 RepID=UPI0010FA6C2B|nr:nuclear respiratory factor 1-like isoform X5 [Scleropages formosus]